MHTPSIIPAENQLTRRHFLGTAAAAWTTISIVPGYVVGAGGQTSPNSRPNLAGVGIGGVGFSQLKSCDTVGFQMTALCDVDQVYAKKAFDLWPQARRYRDFREMLATEGDKIDAVYVGTPDHSHTIIALEALKRKKHVCCVKPLTRTIEEARVLIAAAKQAGTATQVTASPNTSENACRTCELIAAGAIGKVHEVHIWSNRPIWPQGIQRPNGADPVPDTLDWNLWIGPAPMRPFKSKWADDAAAVHQVNLPSGKPTGNKAVYHPFNFRGWWDFGTGALGDMGCHHFNTPFRALNLGAPHHVSASAAKVFAESAPLAAIVTYEFPARGEMPPLKLVWYDGGLKPPYAPELGGEPLRPEGALYVGEAGLMVGAEIQNEERAKQFKNVPRTLPRRGGTWQEWLEAVRGGEKAGCHFEWAGILSEAVQLGNIAIRCDKRLEWNSETASFKNNVEANALTRANYQNGWKLGA
jgi:predicted dehydrogenase